MWRYWRAGVLLLLLSGPVLVYVGLGSLWLAQHRGPLGFPGELLTYAALGWLASGCLAAVLARMWTRGTRPVLPPLSWDEPQTFTPRDRAAWDIVQDEAQKAEELPPGAFGSVDTYAKLGLNLAQRIAAHYHPQAEHPLQSAPVVELLTSLELALEDLEALCREIPGGDLITPAHTRKAVAAAEWAQRANELYTLLLPVFSPLAGLSRLGSRKLLTDQAWKQMKENLVQWFARAFVNRMGYHLIELYSGRLAIGSKAYRRLRDRHEQPGIDRDGPGPIQVGVAGEWNEGRAACLAAHTMSAARGISSSSSQLGHPSGTLFTEAPGIGAVPEKQGSRAIDRAVAHLKQSDIVVLAVDPETELNTESLLVAAWRQQVSSEGDRDLPPVIVLARAPRAGAHDKPIGTESVGTHAGRFSENMRGAREDQVRAALGIVPDAFIDADLVGEKKLDWIKPLEAAIKEMLPRAQRSAMQRYFLKQSERSGWDRFTRQIERHVGRLWH